MYFNNELYNLNPVLVKNRFKNKKAFAGSAGLISSDHIFHNQIDQENYKWVVELWKFPRKSKKTPRKAISPIFASQIQKHSI